MRQKEIAETDKRGNRESQSWSSFLEKESVLSFQQFEIYCG